MRKTGVAFAISTLFWLNSASSTSILFPDDPQLIPELTIPALTDNFQLAQDDLGNQIHHLYLSTDIEPELVAELETIGNERGFSVSTHGNMYRWAEDNMWLSRDGKLIFSSPAVIDKRSYRLFITALTEKSPQAEQEGHHSLDTSATNGGAKNSGESKEISQGVNDLALSQADTFASKLERELIRTFSIIDGGNMLTGQREDSTPYVLVGRDALLQTTLYHSRMDKERIDTKLESMESNGGFNLQLKKKIFRNTTYFEQKGYDTEVDLILLEAANLLPPDLDTKQRHAFAKAARAKAELATTKKDKDNQLVAAKQMLLSKQQSERIIERYRELHGDVLPKSFNLLEKLKGDYARLVVSANLESGFSDEQINEALETQQTDSATLARLSSMLQAGGYQRKAIDSAEQEHQTRRFLAMMAISQHLMAKELKVAERDLVILAQPGFHLDMAMRPLADGQILFNDPEASMALIKQVLDNDGSLDDNQRQGLSKSLTRLEQQAERWHKVYALIRQQLTDAGLTPIATPGSFKVNEREVNWLNGIMGTAQQQPFYITNAASIAPLNNAFSAWLKSKVPNLTTYFVGMEASNMKGKQGLNQAEALLQGSGGLDCITLHHE
ncbi:MAG: hypothetical protein ACRCR1_10995 [Aeromonas sp.]